VPQFVGMGDTGVDHDVNAENAAGAVWNGTAYVPWDDDDFEDYRIPATEKGTSGEFLATLPAGTVRWKLRVREATLADSVVVHEELVSRDVEILAAIAALANSGETVFTLYITSSDARRAAGATVTITSDEAGTLPVFTGITDANGKLLAPLPDGTYYVWARHSRFAFDNPTEITVPEE